MRGSPRFIVKAIAKTHGEDGSSPIIRPSKARKMEIIDVCVRKCDGIISRCFVVLSFFFIFRENVMVDIDSVQFYFVLMRLQFSIPERSV